MKIIIFLLLFLIIAINAEQPVAKSLKVTIKKPHNKKIENVVTPDIEDKTSENYDISIWIKKLNLQRCVFVEIGEEYCALFLEHYNCTTSPPGPPDNYFLGICRCKMMMSWQLCAPSLTRMRREDCTFGPDSACNKVNTTARVHRRLCDLTGIAEWGKPCNCSNIFAHKKLIGVVGFPTCFIPRLPESICSPRNVCGTSKCTASTTKTGNIHKATCSPHCRGKQPVRIFIRLIRRFPYPILSSFARIFQRLRSLG